jgi:hypothetical protein
MFFKKKYSFILSLIGKDSNFVTVTTHLPPCLIAKFLFHFFSKLVLVYLHIRHFHNPRVFVECEVVFVK